MTTLKITSILRHCCLTNTWILGSIGAVYHTSWILIHLGPVAFVETPGLFAVVMATANKAMTSGLDQDVTRLFQLGFLLMAFWRPSIPQRRRGQYSIRGSAGCDDSRDSQHKG